MSGFEIFVPPKPVPGCIPTCLVCNPQKKLTESAEEWAETQAQWAEQQRSPFVLYKLVKPLEEGGVRDPTSEELDAVFQTSLLAKEWVSIGPDRSWVKAALNVLRKVKTCSQSQNIKLYLSNPVPLDQVPPDYTKIILHRNDLGSIETALKENGFTGPDDWINAMRTVFRNVLVYNKKEHGAVAVAIIAAAEAASREFESQLLLLKGITVL